MWVLLGVLALVFAGVVMRDDDVVEAVVVRLADPLAEPVHEEHGSARQIGPDLFPQVRAPSHGSSPAALEDTELTSCTAATDRSCAITAQLNGEEPFRT